MADEIEFDGMSEGEAAGGHRGSCLCCPFNAGVVEEAARAENYACLPTGSEIVEMKRTSGQNWACHEDESKVCAGLCAVAKEAGLDLAKGGRIRYTTWYQQGESVAIEQAKGELRQAAKDSD